MNAHFLHYIDIFYILRNTKQNTPRTHKQKFIFLIDFVRFAAPLILEKEPWSLRNAQFLSTFYINFSFDSMDCARNHRPATFLGRSSWPTSSSNLCRLMNFCQGNITNRVVATRRCAETKRSVFRFPKNAVD